MLILPVILCLIAGKQHRHVRHIIGKKISSDLMLFERMCHTSALSYDIFRFIQSGEQHQNKSHIIIQGKLPQHTIALLQALA
jgi:hypothetical protein